MRVYGFIVQQTESVDINILLLVNPKPTYKIKVLPTKRVRVTLGTGCLLTFVAIWHKDILGALDQNMVSSGYNLKFETKCPYTD